MANRKETFARVDNKGRVTLPRSIREAWKLKTGDKVFFRYNSKSDRIQLVPATGSIDVSTEHTNREFKEECAKTV